MILLSWVLALILWAIAALHAYWGLGGLWPASDAISLTRTVVGVRNLKHMPTLTTCLLVAAILAAVGSWPLFATGQLPDIWPENLVTIGGLAATAVFLARGVAAYLPSWRRHFPEEPFASNDRRYYGPLCLALGAGFVLLLAKGQL